MSVLISDDDYQEYRTLQHNALFQAKLDSVKALKNLRDDIDLPIRNLVAMFALLGCKPLYSCCGFDYDEQPMHKTHEYGDTYIRLSSIEQTGNVLTKLADNKLIEPKPITDIQEISSNSWYILITQKCLQLLSDFDYETSKSGYPWASKSCIHFNELAILKICSLEQEMKTLFIDDFMDEVRLVDTNKLQKACVQYWQYPALEDWVIRKEEIFA